jgi:hypothetical protein
MGRGGSPSDGTRAIRLGTCIKAYVLAVYSQLDLGKGFVSIHEYIPHVLVAFVEGALQGLFEERPDGYVGDTKRPNAGEYVRRPGPAF